MSTELKEKQLTQRDLLAVKEAAFKHCIYFSKLADTFKSLADYHTYSYAYAFQNSYMSQIVRDFADRWFGFYQTNPEVMVNHYFNGDVNRYVEKVNDDIAYAKNIITKFYLSFVSDYQTICQFSSEDEEFFDEIHGVIEEIDDEHLIENPDSVAIERLSVQQHVNLNNVLEEAGL